ncbi:DUF2989 domain-containing protein [Ferrimonas senticii]|uniref:DUF2989 domain-containing protein n=1 Tax=Ferrimonas senticii TaxID=394566 RepID=UPI0004002E04|nr:DUF2989 domain-containing protein [Ferrimonas senticii]
MKIVLLLAITVTILTGCDRTLNINEICAKHPALCVELQQNDLCLRARSDLIHGRHNYQQNPTVELQYQLLLDAERYHGCMDNAAQMVDRDHATAEQRNRGHWFQQAHQLLQQLKAETRDNPSPLLSLYHWLRDKDRAALARFLAAEQQGAISGKAALTLTANYFIDSDPNKALHYLTQLMDRQVIDPKYDRHILELAVSSHQRLGQNQQALLFALIINDDIDQRALAQHYAISTDVMAAIASQAAEVKTLLIAGEFDAKSWKL